MPYITVLGIKIFYEDITGFTPQKPTALLIHGACQSSSNWEFQHNFFQAYNKFNALAIDLPGHGKSQGKGFTSIRHYANFVFAFTEAMKIKDTVLIGHSMGGRICQILLADHKDKVLGAVLAGTGLRIRVTKAVFNILVNDFEGFCKIATKNSFSARTPSEIKQKFYNRLLSTNKESCINDMIACNEFDTRKEMEGIDVPCLVVAGSEDILAPPRHSIELKKKLPNSKLVIMKECGHFMMLEQPEIFNKHLKEFLDIL